MTDSPDAWTLPPISATSGSKNEADASGLNVKATGWLAVWFVPPIVIPVFLALSIAARAMYVAHQ